MLAFIVFIITLLCLGVSYRYTKNIFAPAVYTNLIWLVCILIFWIVPNNLPSLSLRFCGCLALWVVGFTFSSLPMNCVKVRVDNELIEASKLIRDIYLIVSICSAYILFDFYKDVLTYGTYSNIFVNLRYAAVGNLPPYFTETFSQKYGGICSLIWSVSYILEIAYLNKKNKLRFMIILLIVLVYATITVSKAVFVDYFIFSLVTLYLKKQVRLKHLVVVGVILLGVFFLLQFLREGIDFSNVSDRYNFIILYLNSSMSAFDVLEPMSSAHIGENIFRFLYHIFNKLNLSSIEPIEPLLPFISKPIVTNTYTIMYPFYKDFGSVAILIGAIFYGCLYGFFYKRYTTNQNNVWYLVSYIYMFKFLFYQYAAESLLTNLYPAMLTLFLLYFPFWYSKHVPLKIKKECCT